MPYTFLFAMLTNIHGQVHLERYRIRELCIPTIYNQPILINQSIIVKLMISKLVDLILLSKFNFINLIKTLYIPMKNNIFFS